MSRGYQLTPTAQRHVDEIGAFIAGDSVDAALRSYDALDEAFELLTDNPGIGHSREDLAGGRPLKFWSVYSYFVVYDPASAPLTVVAVLHGERDVEQLLKNIPS
ncbi:MAG: type II toxin-antitoxin system RelE/ParE family toxin [Vicinamibacterales bacterium]